MEFLNLEPRKRRVRKRKNPEDLWVVSGRLDADYRPLKRFADDPVEVRRMVRFPTDWQPSVAIIAFIAGAVLLLSNSDEPNIVVARRSVHNLMNPYLAKLRQTRWPLATYRDWVESLHCHIRIHHPRFDYPSVLGRWNRIGLERLYHKMSEVSPFMRNFDRPSGFGISLNIRSECGRFILAGAAHPADFYSYGGQGYSSFDVLMAHFDRPSWFPLDVPPFDFDGWNDLADPRKPSIAPFIFE
jgi:hypothetical protein